MISQSTYITSQLFNNVSLEILSDLFHSERALTIYELNNRYSYRQYQYMLKKLESNLIIKSYKDKKKKYYKLNHFYNELVRSVLEIKRWDLERIPARSETLVFPVKSIAFVLMLPRSNLVPAFASPSLSV